MPSLHRTLRFRWSRSLGKHGIWLLACILYATALSATETPLRVVTLNTVLTEIASAVGGDAVNVTGLIKPGMDPHAFEPSPSDVRTASEADIVLASGLSLEAYLEHIVTNTRAAHRLILVGDALPNILTLPAGSHASEDDVHSHSAHNQGDNDGERDPHWWQSIDNVLVATTLVQTEFTRLRPASTENFAHNAEVYRHDLLKLKAWADTEVGQLPPAKRLLFTTHDAFGYLARDYGFTIYSIIGLSTDGEPNARHLAALIDLIRKNKVKAVFAENSVNSRLIAQLVAETGAQLGGTLYADGLGTSDSPTATYAAMFRHNLSTIVEALK
jgi:zinc/manganese transport system substrate-binding protein